MGRGRRDPPPPIEILGSGADAESVQIVRTGRQRPRRSATRWLAAAIAAGGLLIGGIVLSDDDPPPAEVDHEPSEPDGPAAEPIATSDATTTTIPAGPVFGEPVGAELLVFNLEGWQLVDLDTGGRHRPEGLPVLPSRNTVTAVTGGVVMIVQGSEAEARYYRLRGGADAVEAIDLGPADVVLSAGRPDRVWLAEGIGTVGGPGGGAGPDSGALGPVAEVRLVDLHGEILQSFDVDSSWLEVGLAAGVVLERGGRVYLAGEDGLRAVANGNVLGSVGADLVVTTCDDTGACEVLRQPVGDGQPRRLLPLSDVGSSSYAVGDANGRIAFVNPFGYAPGLVVVAEDGRTVATSAEASTYIDTPVWLPGDLGLLAADDGGLVWLQPNGGEWLVAALPSAIQDLLPQMMFLVE